MARPRVEVEMREEDEKTRKAREAKLEEMRAWAKAKARVKAEIVSITVEASERDNIKAGVSLRERADAAKRKTEEAGALIRSIEEAET